MPAAGFLSKDLRKVPSSPPSEIALATATLLRAAREMSSPREPDDAAEAALAYRDS